MSWSLKWSKLLHVLIHKEVHASVVCVNHFLNVVQVGLLQEVNFFAIRGGKTTNEQLILLIWVVFKNDCLWRMINSCFDIVLHDDWAKNLKPFWLLQLESIFNLLKANGLEVFLVLNDVDLECDCLQFVLKGELEGTILELCHSLENFDVAKVLVGFLPVRLVKITYWKHNIVSACLRKKLHASHVVLFHQLTEIFVDDMLLYNKLVHCNIRDLQEHWCRHVDAV